MLRAGRVLVKTEPGVVNVLAKVWGAAMFRLRYIQNCSDIHMGENLLFQKPVVSKFGLSYSLVYLP